ncbi:MAG: protein kinase [Acidobacteriota bacterium]|nr:MAG: protein kinase [Acidobacteriota bacterium]
MGYCLFCDVENPPGAVFCSGCGASLEEAAEGDSLAPASAPSSGASRAAPEPPVEAATPFAKGSVLSGRYELLEVSGSGTYASIWKARDQRTGEAVAVKVLDFTPFDEAENKEAKARFLREGAICQKLKHDHIVRVFEVDEAQDTPYFVMEWMQSQSLRYVLDKKGALGVPQAVDIARKVAEALECAHGMGVYHRDLKPANIVFNEDGEVKLTDFGIAKVLDDMGEGGLTRPGTVLGTIEYIAPEYISDGRVGPASDIYSLGMVLYEMLAGRLAFTGKTPLDIMRKHLKEIPVPPSQKNPNADISPLLESVVLKCLDKNPEDRYGNPSALLKDLDRAVPRPSEAPQVPGQAPAEAGMVGRTIRDYEIVELLGEGGMASVYKARHTRLGSFRAIKVIRRELGEQPNFYERFRAEAQIAERLSHPSLAILHDFSQTDDGLIYAVWEFVEGDTIQKRFGAGKPFLPQEAAEIVWQVAGGLVAAHQQGIYHRDIAPDNIILLATEDGSVRVKVIDFGIAKFVRGEDENVQTDYRYFLGKVGYSAPEQIGNLKPGEVLDGRCDVFSLGAVLYELLAGQRLFKANAFFPYMKELALMDPSSLAFPGSVPEALQTVVRRAVQPDRNARYASMEEFTEEFLHVMNQAFAEPAPSEEEAPEPAEPEPAEPEPAEPEPAEPEPAPPAAERAAPRPRPVAPAKPVPPPRLRPITGQEKIPEKRTPFRPPLLRETARINLEHVSLPALLGNMFRQKKTGALCFSFGAHRFDVYAHAGAVVNIAGDGAAFVKDLRGLASPLRFFTQNPEIKCAFGATGPSAVPHDFSLSLAALMWEVCQPEDVAKAAEVMRDIKASPALTMSSMEIAKHIALTSEEAYFLGMVEAASSFRELLASSPLETDDAARLVACLVWMGAIPVASEEPQWLDADLFEHALNAETLVSKEQEAEKQKILSFYEKLREAPGPADVLGVSSTAIDAHVESAHAALAQEYAAERFSPAVRKALSHELAMIGMRLSEAYLLMLNRKARAPDQAPVHDDAELLDDEKYRVRVSTIKTSKEKEQEDKLRIAESYYHQAQAAFKKNDYWPCIQLCEAAVSANPGRPEFYILMGRAQRKNPKWIKRAITSLEKAISLDLVNEEARLELAKLYIEKGMKTRARHELEELMRHIPKSQEAADLLSGLGKRKR